MVCKENMCTGCKACVDKCPKNAITIVDTLKSYNAVIDKRLCINCGACYKVCQLNYSVQKKEPIQWYQGWAKQDSIRNNGSSGGLAATIMNSFIENGGVVCSCVFEKGRFGFQFAESADDVKKFIGSKYVKSDPQGIYKQIAKRLSDNQRVLFIGLPCQVAGIKKYVGNNEKGLYTIDLICHGTPSPKILNMFLEEYNLSLDKASDIRFRKKQTFKVYEGFSSIVPDPIRDCYSFAFTNCLDYLDSCYDCTYATKDRVGDLSLGDSWGTELKDEESKGISLILCQTESGRKLLEQAAPELFDVNVSIAMENNHQLRHPSIAPSQRELFFKTMEKKGFNKAIAKCYPNFYCRQAIKSILVKMKLLGGGVTTDCYKIYSRI